jgi:hypothetical protein
MTVAEEIPQLYDCFLVKLDIKNCPMAEIALVDLFDLVTSTLHENYLDTVRRTIAKMLEDAMWMDETTRTAVMKSGFALFEVREGQDLVISLRAAALQRYIAQPIANRPTPITTLRIPIMIQFKQFAVSETLRTQIAPIDVVDIVGDLPPGRSGPPSKQCVGNRTFGSGIRATDLVSDSPNQQ